MPSSFNDLDQKELYRAAIEDFAVEVKKTDNAAAIRAALLESGVTWNDYIQQHPEFAPEVEEVKEPTNVVTSSDVTGRKKKSVVRTAEPAVTEEEALYLVKMSRKNPLFEFGKYKFTKDNPFVVMDADSTNKILTTEEGFSIATPAEAQDYYSVKK